MEFQVQKPRPRNQTKRACDCSGVITLARIRWLCRKDLELSIFFIAFSATFSMGTASPAAPGPGCPAAAAVAAPPAATPTASEV